MYKAILVSILPDKVELIREKLRVNYTNDADLIVAKVVGGTPSEIFIDVKKKCIACKNDLETDGASNVDIKKIES